MFRVNKCIKNLPKEEKAFMLAWGRLWKNLHAYVKKNLPTGLQWQFRGDMYTLDAGKPKEEAKPP
jgi:hypothetical protein